MSDRKALKIDFDELCSAMEDSSYEHDYYLNLETGEILFISDYMDDEEIDIPVLKIDRQVEIDQVAYLKKVKAERDQEAVRKTLENLRQVAASNGNTFEAILECSRAYVSIGEMCDVLREVWGEWVEGQSAMAAS